MIKASQERATAIAWTDQTWNPVSGCSKVSEGCRFCYAETLSLRFGRSKAAWTALNAPVNVRIKPDKLRDPIRIKAPSRIFVNSMSDLFQPEVPSEFIVEVLDVMRATPRHAYQVLTKRPERLAEFSDLYPPNCWLGVSIESDRHVDRADYLREIRLPAVRFISAEPLLGPLPSLSLDGLDWVIAGGESGGHIGKHPERHMDHAWARDLRDRCVAAGIPFFFKQSSAVRAEVGIHLQEADGTFWHWREFPDAWHSNPFRGFDRVKPEEVYRVSSKGVRDES